MSQLSQVSNNDKIVAVDIESTKIVNNDVEKLWSISWYSPDTSGSVYWEKGITKERLSQEFAAAGVMSTVTKDTNRLNLLKLRQILTGETEYVPAFHNAQFDKRVLSKAGVEIPKYHDTMVLAYCMFPPAVLGSTGEEDAMRFYSLESLSRLGICEPKLEFDSNWDEFSFDMLDYNMQDAKSCHQAATNMLRAIDPVTLGAYRLDLIATEAIINFVGPYIDANKLQEVFLEKDKRLQEVKDRLFQLVPCVAPKVKFIKKMPPEGRRTFAKAGVYPYSDIGKIVPVGEFKKGKMPVLEIVEFNPNSDDHVRVALKALCPEWKPTKKTKSGNNFSVDKTVLAPLAAKSELAKLLLENSELSKLISTYLSPYANTDEWSRMHPSFLTCATRTSRLSSRNPNFQNVPDNDTRNLIRAPNEDWRIVCIDLSQIELRILGWYMKMLMPNIRGSDYFYRLYEIDADVHDANMDVMGTRHRDHGRRLAKIGIFLYIYGGKFRRFSDSLSVSLDDAKSIISSLEKNIPALPQLRETVVRQARYQRTLRTLYGHKIEYPDLFLPDLPGNRYAIKKAERQYFNALIQGSQADIIKILMWLCHNILCRLYGARIICQVHDELVFEVPVGLVKPFCDRAMPIFNNRKLLPGFKVQGVPGIGMTWREAKQDGDRRKDVYIKGIRSGQLQSDAFPTL